MIWHALDQWVRRIIIIIIVIIIIMIIIIIIIIPTAPRIPPDQYPRRGKRRGAMSLVG